MIDASGIATQVAAAVSSEDFKIRIPFKHSVEDQVMQRDRGLQAIADDVIEVEP
jgi:hypothetical protein